MAASARTAQLPSVFRLPPVQRSGGKSCHERTGDGREEDPVGNQLQVDILDVVELGHHHQVGVPEREEGQEEDAVVPDEHVHGVQDGEQGCQVAECQRRGNGNVLRNSGCAEDTAGEQEEKPVMPVKRRVQRSERGEVEHVAYRTVVGMCMIDGMQVVKDVRNPDRAGEEGCIRERNQQPEQRVPLLRSAGLYEEKGCGCRGSKQQEVCPVRNLIAEEGLVEV